MTPAYTPSNETVVLERAAAGDDPRVLALRRSRLQLDGARSDARLAAAYARQAIELGREEGDPRYFGYAEAALAMWDDVASAPVEIVWLRAVLRQQRHDFSGALADLDALLLRAPDYAPARLTRAVIHLVQGRPRDARRDCAALTGSGGLSIAATCAAAAASLSGNSAGAISTLESLRIPLASSPVEQRLWSLTLVAEIQARMEQPDMARASFERAIAALHAANASDPYLLIAYADFLLDQREPAKVRSLLRELRRNDNALLRLALAEAQLGGADAQHALAEYRRELAGRFAATRARGESTHAREEAMYSLFLLHDPATALKQAQENWRVQREPLDARILLEAARAAGDTKAADPVREWMRQTDIEDPRLHRLAFAP